VKPRRAGLPLVLLALSTACAVGPDYRRPEAPVPASYREPLPPAAVAPDAWKPAEPKDAAARGKWWEVFGDPDLNALEEQVSVSNQDIAQVEAQFRAARAAVRGARADFYPVITASPGVSRGTTRAGASSGESPPVITTYQVPVDLSYEVDVFGRIRRTVENSAALAQASAADLETVRLTMQAELATDYFLLRGLDAQRRVLESNVAGYQTALQLTVNRHNQGIVSGVDVAQAETQLYTTRAQYTDVAIGRAQFEHAIAVLVGRPPGDFTIESSRIDYAPPAIPVAVPSELLERRPEIAASERRAAAANAQIGIATSAFFPRLLLSATGGYASPSLADLFTLPSRFWSIGASAVATLFQGGKRRAATEQARAGYDAAVAAYRLNVLAAFQQVEDNLAALRYLSEEAVQQADATAAAERSLTLARSRYEGGITTYLEVVTAQSAALVNERASIDLLTRRMTASVNLIKALGGGWSAATLPNAGVAPGRSVAQPDPGPAATEPR
jgi:NodT family efflux transporter outer membrane factor (OMF) lipoprotein